MLCKLNSILYKISYIYIVKCFCKISQNFCFPTKIRRYTVKTEPHRVKADLTVDRWTTAELHTQGFTDRNIKTFAKDGLIKKLYQGRYQRVSK